MTFEPTDEVLQIKRQLQEKEGIQVDQIRLIYSGKQLADDKPLEFYNIQAGGTIHMVLQLPRAAAGVWGFRSAVERSWRYRLARTSISE